MKLLPNVSIPVAREARQDRRNNHLLACTPTNNAGMPFTFSPRSMPMQHSAPPGLTTVGTLPFTNHVTSPPRQLDTPHQSAPLSTTRSVRGCLQRPLALDLSPEALVLPPEALALRRLLLNLLSELGAAVLAVYPVLVLRQLRVRPAQLRVGLADTTDLIDGQLKRS